MEEVRDFIKIYIDYSNDFAMINENITYSIILENTSNQNIKEVFVSINIPEYTEYCDESLVCSLNYKISDEESGIILDELKANSRCTIFYKVEVIKVPEEGTIINRNFTKYKIYNQEILEVGSNILYTRIKGALIKREEDFRKNIVDGQLRIGEIITFEIIIKNTGNLTAFDLFLSDIVPRNIEPLLEKVIINNRIVALESLRSISLGNLGPYKSLIIRYKALVKGTTLGDETFSLGKLKYRYFNDSIGDYIDAESLSNELILNINEAIINNFKCNIDKESYILNDDIFCRFNIENSGNTSALNTRLYIDLPEGVEIKSNSVFINGEENKIENFRNIELGDLKSFQRITVSFKGKIKNINNGEKCISGKILYDYNDLELDEVVSKCKESNIVKFNVYGVVINNNTKVIERSINKEIYKIGEEIEYKLTIENKGNLKCSNVKLNELEEFGQEVLRKSLKINGISIEENNKKYFFIGNINPGEKKEISYKSKIIDIPSEEVIRSRAYIEYFEGNNSNEIKKLWCREKDIKVVGAKIETALKVEEFYNINEEAICCSLNIRNVGNKKANRLKLIIFENSILNVSKITYCNKENKIIESQNVIEIEHLDCFEELEVKIEIEIMEAKFHNKVLLDGEVQYSYFSDNEESQIENSICSINKQYLKFFYPNLDLTYNTWVKGIEANEEFEVNLVVKNTGNINLSNIKIWDIIGEGFDLLYCSELYKNNFIVLESLRVEEEKIITIILKGRNDFYESTISIGGKVIYEYFCEKAIELTKSIEPLQLEFINSQIEMKLSSEKNEIILGESIYNSLIIKNKGLYNLFGARLYIIYDNVLDTVINPKVAVNNKLVKFNDLDKFIELGSVESGESLIIKYTVTPETINNRNIYCKLIGYYKFKDSGENREKIFYSNKALLKVQKISLKSFLSADKDIVYKGDKVKYSSVLINDGTVPLNISYKLNVNKSLVPQYNGFTVNGVIIDKKDFYCTTINPSEGISIDELYSYNNSFGGNKLLAEASTNYSYSIDGKEYKNISGKTERLFIDAAFTTFKEVIIEHKEKLIDFEEELISVSNVYVSTDILNYYIVDRFKNIDTNNDIISSTKVVVRGIITLKIEYISKTNNVYIHNKHLDFVTFIILPKEFKDGDKIEIKGEVLDIYYKIIDLSYLFLNINLIIKALF